MEAGKKVANQLTLIAYRQYIHDEVDFAFYEKMFVDREKLVRKDFLHFCQGVRKAARVFFVAFLLSGKDILVYRNNKEGRAISETGFYCFLLPKCRSNCFLKGFLTIGKLKIFSRVKKPSE